MSSRKKSKVVLAVCFVLVCVAASATASADGARVVEVYPDTYEPNDAGEYVAVEFKGANTTGWTLGDGEDEAALPNSTLDGTVYFADEGTPEDRRDRFLGLRLANSGEAIVLRNASDEVVDEVRYGDESDAQPGEGEIVVRVGDAPTAFETRHIGATDFGVLRANVSGVTAFALPDAPGVVTDEFRRADERVLVSAFTFGSQHLADALRETEADVSVLVEGTPPGGFGVPTERALGSLAEAADVYVADGERRRYRFLHAKYAVADDSAVVTSENWGDRNFAPDAAGSRGWGVIVEGEKTADYLARVLREDVGWRAVSSWENASVESREKDESDADVRTGFDAVETGTAEIELFVTPDESVEPVVSLIESADEEVLVQQSYVRAWSDGNLSTNPYVAALEERAEAGVDVRVLLDGRWYYEEENAEIVDALNASGIDTRLAAYPVHTKGVVVDGESVLVSSINWNENSPTENREVGVVVHDEEVAGYFDEVFETDWDAEGDGTDGSEDAAPTDYALEIVIIVVVSGMGVWLVTREM